MRRLLVLVCLLACVLTATACGGSKKSPQDLLAAFCAAYGDMPAGHVYCSGRAEWEDGYLSPALSDSLFLQDNGENAFSLCRTYAILLATGFEGGEIAILSCAGSEDAARVAEMCSARIRRVKQARPQADVVQNACVLRSGSTVVLLMLPDNNRAKDIAERLL